MYASSGGLHLVLFRESHRYTAPTHLAIIYLTPRADSSLPQFLTVRVCRHLNMNF
jgi:hypothetical protein